MVTFILITLRRIVIAGVFMNLCCLHSCCTNAFTFQLLPPRHNAMAVSNPQQSGCGIGAVVDCNSGSFGRKARFVNYHPRTFKSVLFVRDERQQSDESSITSLNAMDRPLLAAVDFIALIVFAAIGKASHSSDGDVAIFETLETAFPFLSSWFVTSTFTGVYNIEKNNKNNLISGTLLQVGKGWIIAVPLGCVLRGIIKGYSPPVPFAIVTMISTLVILVIARVLFSVVEDLFVELVN